MKPLSRSLMRDLGGEPSLVVVRELPPGAVLVDPQALVPVHIGLRGPRYYHCRRCEGYIEGEPVERRVNTLGVLSGRCGTEYRCRRCGMELAYHGMMA